MLSKFFSRRNDEKRKYQQELRYCPSCNIEYRPEIVTCVHCNITLVSAAEKLAAQRAISEERSEHSMLIAPEDTLVSLRQGSFQEMKAIQYLLLQEHIPSILSGDEMSCHSCSPQLTLEIKEVDLSIAEQILAHHFVQSTGISINELAAVDNVFDMQATEVSCPACSSRFSPVSGCCPDCGLNFMGNL